MAATVCDISPAAMSQNVATDFRHVEPKKRPRPPRMSQMSQTSHGFAFMMGRRIAGDDGGRKPGDEYLTLPGLRDVDVVPYCAEWLANWRESRVDDDLA
jgi:hypothetical protein